MPDLLVHSFARALPSQVVTEILTAPSPAVLRQRALIEFQRRITTPQWARADY